MPGTDLLLEDNHAMMVEALSQLALEIKHLEDITLLPFGPGEPPIGLAFGAYRKDGSFAEEFELRRNDHVSSRLPLTGEPLERVRETVLYCGHMNGHYGHFLLESLSRFWAIKRMHPNVGLIWQKGGRMVLLDWQKAFFEHHGIDPSRFRQLQKPTLFESILVPTPGYVIQNQAHPRHVESLAFRCTRVLDRRLKVWLSRSALTLERCGVDNEPLLEQALEQQGWMVAHPEQMPLEDQVTLLENARMVAGFEGSAFHTMILVPHPPELVILFPRHNNCQPSGNHHTIARIKGFEQVVFNAAKERTTGLGQHSRYRVLDPDEILGQLKEAEDKLDRRSPKPVS